MAEKRLECLMMLQIHRSDTPSIDAICHHCSGDLTFYRATLCVSAVFAVARCLCPDGWRYHL